MLRGYFARPMGLGNSASSVMTAGLVMGIVLIPFVFSLTDDIIIAVPQAMRDGSLGLGAARSETIRQVVISAALPGIVGAILLAASRAIGETMIVALGAGAAARLSLNPFEVMTTVSVRIVSQLTGDGDFAAPETLVILLASVLGNGLGAFRQTYIPLDVALAADQVNPAGTRDPAEMARVTNFGYAPLIEQAMRDLMVHSGIATDDIRGEISGEYRQVIDGLPMSLAAGFVSKGAAATLRDYVLAHSGAVGETIRFDVLANGRIDGYFKGRVTYESALNDTNISQSQFDLARELQEAGLLETAFSPAFLIAPDASDQRPEAAGHGVAILGSLYMMIVVLALAIGVAASIYLVEFTARNRFTDLIEVNIANLAAVPYLVFGILGLAIFTNLLGLSQSAPIVGGLVRTLMTLPSIIIATRASLKGRAAVASAFARIPANDGAAGSIRRTAKTAQMQRKNVLDAFFRSDAALAEQVLILLV